ncbi:MAG TPA: PHP domain-containing protein, partial [Candidatus Paceibacterota bacterium]|nr:PHP domain-containing protein [Candidatus Paceibacterota bacterium]
MAGRYIHLHTHSHYSFLQALPKVPELVKAAKAAGMDALGLTDAGNLHAGIEFYKAAEKAGIKPILGVDAYLAQGSRRQVHEVPAERGGRTRLVLLAMNNEGYQNLLTLITASFTEGYHERPHMDKELLRSHHAGLIALIPSFAGEVAQHLKQGDKKGAAAAIEEYVSIFGKENVYLEITHHPKVEGHAKRMEEIRKLAKESGVPLVAQHDVYYLKPSDREATEVMRRIAHGERGRNEDEDFSFVSESQMREWFADVPEAVDASGEIADRCSIHFELGSWNFPAVEVEPGKTHEEMLRERTYDGLAMRGMDKT